MLEPSFDLATLSRAYAEGRLKPSDVARIVAERIEEAGDDNVWISRRSAEAVVADAVEIERRLAAEGADALPLYGIPFAVKDNIDVAGMPTTAGCPDFAYQPDRSATAFDRLRAAGALFVGKTNLDQFATGLVGVRSPYGVSRNPFDADYIPGGSSSGSAVAVSSGLVSFALGTDTAGSGRVPAGFNNIVGLKPTRGLISTAGVFPACRSIDCISIFALTVADAMAVLDVAGGFDPRDIYSRAAPAGYATAIPGRPPPRFRFGVPADDQLQFFGNDAAARLFASAIEALTAMGGERTLIDYAPFAEAAGLLYGPLVAERTAALDDFLTDHADAIHPVVRKIAEGGKSVGGSETWNALYRLEALRQRTRPVWSGIDLMLLPTSPTIYRIDEVEADPLRLNSNLGTYTNFVNLLDLSAIAVPNGFQPNGLPAGITLIAPAWREASLAAVASRFHAARGLPLGATGNPPPDRLSSKPVVPPGTIGLAVVGAHLSAMALNRELIEIGATFRCATRTAPNYRFVALPDGKRPGLVRTNGDGASIDIEIWNVPEAALGGFVSRIAAPLGIGTLVLEDGTGVLGFLCEACAADGAEDISAFGGWRAYKAAR
ncbi:MAG: atzF [Rhodospirillales bacterium]|nr:atzF [Rhodospirillales bacterium]